jgi:Flp pilus assembly protein TadD
LLQRQLPQAVSWLREFVEQNPRNVPTLLRFGIALARAGQMDEARTAIRRLLELHPTNSVRW